MSENVHVLTTVEFNKEQLAELQALSPRIALHSNPLSQGQDLPGEQWGDIEVLYTFQALPQPEQAPKLRWIQFHSAGVEEQVETPLLQQPNLIATTLSGANAPQVAEHALALMLALGHHVPEMFADQSRSQWPTRRTERYMPKEVMGSTVGIVGYGSIGQRLARLLQSFGVTVLASKRDLLNPSKADFQVDGQGDSEGEIPRRLYPGKALATMFKECDFVVITVPLTAETRGLVGAKQLAALRPDALLVDVSRGGVLDHAALIQAMGKGQVAGAALDVFPQEPLPADSPLWEMPNVIVSPHIAGFSPHYTARAFILFKENLRRYLNGEELVNQIDLQRGY
jgi:phosphoglycerate dehydrogenase-like enzyme